MKTVIVSVLLLVVSVGAGAAEFKFLAARQAQAKYQAALRKAQDEYISDLNAAKAAAMKANNLDEANAIAAEIEATTTPTGIVGKFRVRFTNGVERTYNFERGGRVDITEEKGQPDRRYRLESGLVVMDRRNVERVHLDGDRLHIERWRDTAAVPADRFPDAIGIGHRKD